MTALSVLGGQFRLKPETRAELYRDFLPWALRAGFRSADLMCLYYERHFEVVLHHIEHCTNMQIAIQLCKHANIVIMSCCVLMQLVQIPLLHST